MSKKRGIKHHVIGDEALFAARVRELQVIDGRGDVVVALRAHART